MTQIRIWNVKIDNTTMEGALCRSLQEGEKNCVVVTPNALMLDACRRDPKLGALLNEATLSLADGAGVMLAARRQGTPLKERIAGIEYGERLLERAAETGLRVFLLGGRDGVAARAACRLVKKYPGLCICGTHGGYFNQHGRANEQLLRAIYLCRTDILLVCFGFPLQEAWIMQNRKSLTAVRVIAGLGGSLDVWAGESSRAPEAFSKRNLEWAWRMLKEPHRISKLPTLTRFACMTLLPHSATELTKRGGKSRGK